MASFEGKGVSALAKLHDKFSDFTPETSALIGVSGGRDSVALLHFLVAQGWKNLIVAHFNHGLRGRESGQDAAFVRRLAKTSHLFCEVYRENIEALAQRYKLSLETAARHARDLFFKRLAEKHQTKYVFLAHHADDNAETILGNLLRGSGKRGVSGMALDLETDDGLIKLRPLLDVSRAEVDVYTEFHALSFREDSSNASLEHRRNRLRHEVLPLLNDVLQRDVAPLLARFGSLAAQDDDFLQETSLSFITEHQLFDETSRSLRITETFGSLHVALQSRVILFWLRDFLKLSNVGHKDVVAVMSMLQKGGPAKVNLPEDVWIRRKAKRLFVSGRVFSVETS